MRRTASGRSRSTTSGAQRNTSAAASVPVHASARTVTPASSRTLRIRRRASGSASAMTMLRAMAGDHRHQPLADRWTDFGGLAPGGVQQDPRDLLRVVPGGDVPAAGERDVAGAGEAPPRPRRLARVDQDAVLLPQATVTGQLGSGPV